MTAAINLRPKSLLTLLLIVVCTIDLEHIIVSIIVYGAINNLQLTQADIVEFVDTVVNCVFILSDNSLAIYVTSRSLLLMNTIWDTRFHLPLEGESIM